MFENSMVDDRARTARPYTVSLSLVLQVAAAAAAVTYPLLRIEPLPRVALRAPMPAPVILVEVPREVSRAQAASSAPLLAAPVTMRRTYAGPPRSVPNSIFMGSDIGMPPQLSGPAGPEGGFTIPGYTGAPATVAVPQAPPVRSAPAPEPRQQASGPVKVGGDVRPPRLLREVRPQYPPLARVARIQGTVRIEAVLARDGTVRDARAVSGHPLLVAAALDAVRQWQYQATLLNGQPVEVALSIDVNFTLSQR